MDSQKIKVGISACLLGQAVRFDGGHKNAPFCSQVLSKWFEFVPVCPEVEIGLGVPREPIRLVNEHNQIRVKSSSDTNLDYTHQLHAVVDQKTSELSELCGYILMQKSPSCGLFNVKVFTPHGTLESKSSMGAFAYQLKHNFPQLPIEEAARIDDIRCRENFIIRVFAYHEWQQLVRLDPEGKKLWAFHRRYQLLLQAYSEESYGKLSAILAEIDIKPLDKLMVEYFSLFSECLSQTAKTSGHVKSMLHILDELKKVLPADVEFSIAQLIKRYEEQKVVLMVPLTLLKYYVKMYPVDCLMEQKYLNLYPHELGLRHNY